MGIGVVDISGVCLMGSTDDQGAAPVIGNADCDMLGCQCRQTLWNNMHTYTYVYISQYKYSYMHVVPLACPYYMPFMQSYAHLMQIILYFHAYCILIK